MSVQSAKKLIDRALADLAKRGQVYTAQDVEAVLIDCIGLFDVEEKAPESVQPSRGLRRPAAWKTYILTGSVGHSPQT